MAYGRSVSGPALVCTLTNCGVSNRMLWDFRNDAVSALSPAALASVQEPAEQSPLNAPNANPGLAAAVQVTVLPPKYVPLAPAITTLAPTQLTLPPAPNTRGPMTNPGGVTVVAIV